VRLTLRVLVCVCESWQRAVHIQFVFFTGTSSSFCVSQTFHLLMFAVTPLSEVKEKAVIGIPADAKFQEACGAEETLKSNTSGDLLSKKSVRRSKKKVEDVLKVVLAMDREAMLLNLREQHLSSKGLKCFLVQRLVKALCVENVVTSQAKRTVGSCGVGGSRCR